AAVEEAGGGRGTWRTRSPQNLGGRVFVGRGDSSPECITAAFHGIVAAMSGECASTTIWAVSGAYAAEHVIASATVPPHMPPVHRPAPPHTWVFHRFVPISRGLFR